MLRYYHGLDKSPPPKAPSKDSPGIRSTVSASRSVFAATAHPKNSGNTHSKSVETSHVAALIGMSQPEVDKKLRQLIQDGKLQGILDQGGGQLIVPEKPASSAKPSKPISLTTPPLPESSAPFRAPTWMPLPAMAPIEDFLDPKESEEAKDYAASAKKVLILRTTDYVAYLNALLKANADEDIISESEGIDAIVNELLCFLAMKALGKSPLPSVKIHRAWRILVLTRPLAYIEMCKAMDMSSSFAIDEEKFDPDGGEGDSLHIMQSDMMKKRYEYTKTTYAALFQSQPPYEFWPPTSGAVVETSEVPYNHLEFLNEENLPLQDDDCSTMTESTISSHSSDVSQEPMRAGDVLNEFLFGWTLADRFMADLAKKNNEKDTLIAKRDQEIALLKNVMSPYRKLRQDKPEGVDQAVDVDQDIHKEVRADFGEDTSPPLPRQVRFEQAVDVDPDSKHQESTDSPSVCINAQDLSEVSEKSESEHVKETEIEAEDIEAETIATKTDSSKDLEVNSPPTDTEGLGWQKNGTNYFSERVGILAEAADRSLAGDLCTATTVEEEATFQKAPPSDTALIFHEDDKDIEMACVECILKGASGTRAFVRKKKASSWIEIRAS